MALAGLSVVSAYAGAPSGQPNPQALLGRIIGAENITAPGNSGLTAPQAGKSEGDPVWQLRAAQDMWVAFGPSPAPDAAAPAPRIFLPAGTTETLYAIPGDKVGWVAA